MSISTVVTRGFGSHSDAYKLPTRGYSTSSFRQPIDYKPRSVDESDDPRASVEEADDPRGCVAVADDPRGTMDEADDQRGLTDEADDPRHVRDTYRDF